MNKDPNFSAYSAKPLDRAPSLRRRLGKLKQESVYGVLLLPYGIYKHRRLLASCERIDNHTYTCFLRAPTQLQALAGPVLRFLGQPDRVQKRLEILTFACSNGAEVYTMASWLLQNCPGLDFHITASDLHQEMVERCQAARYTPAEALQSEYITTKFVEATFDKDGDAFVVKPEVRARASFSVSNLLDREGLMQKFQPADVVTAQNVLFHLSPDNVRRAFANLVGLLKPKSALFVEGMDLELRLELTEKFGLEPLDYELRRIYSETRVHTPKDWWKYYWGTEPYIPLRANKKRRYATIFLKG
jgi:chemotaxis methyl-accepting protein methylase